MQSLNFLCISHRKSTMANQKPKNTGKPTRTSSEVASLAGKTLRDRDASKEKRSLAGSALVQRKLK